LRFAALWFAFFLQLAWHKIGLPLSALISEISGKKVLAPAGLAVVCS